MSAKRPTESVLKKAQRLVVKVGSGLVTNAGLGLDHAALTGWLKFLC